MLRARWISPCSLSAEDEPLRTELEADLIDELLKRGLGASLGMVPTLAIIWEVVGGVGVASRPGTAWLFLAFGGLVLIRLVWLWVRRTRKAPPTLGAFAFYVALSGGIGIGMAAIVWCTVPVLVASQMALLATIVVAMNSIAVVSMAPSPTAYGLYSVWNLLAVLVVSITHPTLGFTFTCMVALYMLVLTVMTYLVHSSLHGQMLLTLKLREVALRDPLTGLRNRRGIAEAMSRESARAERSLDRGITFVMVDIDHFKRINDRHGHAAGDAVLRELAVLLSSSVRRMDLVARWGGEEFLVVAIDVRMGVPFPLPERIRRRVEDHTFTLPGGDELHCTCSIGVASMPPGRPSGEWDRALAAADHALYAAKAAGRNRVVAAEPAAAVAAA